MVLSEDDSDEGSLTSPESVCCWSLVELSSLGSSSEGLMMGFVLLVDSSTLQHALSISSRFSLTLHSIVSACFF